MTAGVRTVFQQMRFTITFAHNRIVRDVEESVGSISVARRPSRSKTIDATRGMCVCVRIGTSALHVDRLPSKVHKCFCRELCLVPIRDAFTSAILRECSSAQFDSALNLCSRPDGDLTQLGEWPENCVVTAIIMIILVARFSLSVAMKVLATSSIASVFTVMCSCFVCSRCKPVHKKMSVTFRSHQWRKKDLCYEQ